MKYIVDISEDDFSNIIENGFTNSDQRNRIVYAICHASYAKTGHWINIDEKSAVCSCCNRNNTLYGDFCKWCGADMRKEQT